MPVKKSALVAALVSFLALAAASRASMPHTETIATLPEGTMELLVEEEFFTHDNGYRRDTFGIGFGIVDRLCARVYFQYLHDGFPSSRDAVVGDTFVRLWWYAGGAAGGALRWGLLALFRFPTGPNAYTDERWRNLALGNNELKLGPVAQYQAGVLFFHANLFYVFREKNREGFYNGLYLNPAEKQTYNKAFGLNFMSDGTFLYSKRLENDYAVASLALNTDALYPFIPWVSAYVSRRFARVRDEIEEIPVEGALVNPLLFSAGARYFFSYNTFAGISATVSAVRKRQYPGETIGIEMRLQF
ncbi:MAG: hypothetical protein EHM32_04280 [Spirochaetales bacterium]|nr:MAG: hypothetical protein EHM32_04280 [Spirochaetales bacterium]